MTREERMTFINDSLPIKKQIVEELGAIGYPIVSMDEDLKRYYYLKEDTVRILLNWVEKIDNPVLIENLVRHLAATKVKYDGSVLTRVFDKLGADFVYEKWAIANTLAATKPINIKSWIASSILNSSHGMAREMLIDVAVRELPTCEAIPLLEKVFFELPIHVSSGLLKIGKKDELNFLEDNMSKLPEGNTKKYVKNVIIKMQKKNV